MDVKHVETFGDLLLVVQQVSKVCQYYNGSLNAYLDKCLDIISYFDEFVIRYLLREENGQANVGDWTFGSSPHPQKCYLTCLQGHNEMEPSITEGIG